MLLKKKNESIINMGGDKRRYIFISLVSLCKMTAKLSMEISKEIKTKSLEILEKFSSAKKLRAIATRPANIKL